MKAVLNLFAYILIFSSKCYCGGVEDICEITANVDVSEVLKYASAQLSRSNAEAAIFCCEV